MLRTLKKLVYATTGAALRHRLRKLYFGLRFRYDFRRAFARAEPEMEILDRFVRPGGRVLDVGANVGYYTVVLSRGVGAEGRVFAFEPIPETFDILRANVRRLGLRNVRLFHLAVTDRRGTARMEIPRSGEGGPNFYQATLARGARPETAVRVGTESLDGLGLETFGRVDFIKCDAEGSEHLVLAGARRLLAACRPVLLVEVSAGSSVPGHDPAALFEWLRGLGFTAFRYSGGDLLPSPRPSGSANYFFLPAGVDPRGRPVAAGSETQDLAQGGEAELAQ